MIFYQSVIKLQHDKTSDVGFAQAKDSLNLKENELLFEWIYCPPKEEEKYNKKKCK